MTSLAELTTLRIGGTPKSLTIATSESQIIDAVQSADDQNQDLLIMGCGSNLVVSDDFAGDVLMIATKGIENDASACAGAWVTVQAGENWDDFVSLAVSSGWCGIESLSGIPGTVGATPIQNVGAYGQQVSDTIAQVRAYNRKQKSVQTLFVKNCQFDYRDSIFKNHQSDWVILSVVFQLPLGTLSQPIAYQELADELSVQLGERAPLNQVRDAVLKLRSKKGMVLVADDFDTWSTGSYFTNPVVEIAPAGAPVWPAPNGKFKVSAAWLIEQSGLGKGFGLNQRVTISTKHSLAITNRGNGTSSDVFELADYIQSQVVSKFGIQLEIEPRVVR
ncbi:MAG: UDP-N-acetylmuramate dehydrogenase [Actinobacteria bacterium]|nr:UDP-N-acetylmuramate dehydrogenase [Actinomycetota bacterium]NBY15159.1 UDP-N-acetylmuramate dehydrogenase [Actinomycetota bacterium]